MDTQFGEGFSGEGHEVAHINTVLGMAGGPVEAAWAIALATPRVGHIPFVVVLRPNLPVKPPTLFVNKAPLEGERHQRLTWGAAQAGVAGGVADAVADGVILPDRVVLIVAVWVAPEAEDEEAVYENNRSATSWALVAGASGDPLLADVLAARDEPANPYFRS